jgi:ATP/ADP translocase
MHRTIGYLSKRFVQIRPGEGRKVWLTFLYFFLVITAYYVIKPVSRSLVLDDLGSRLVPYADLICAILMGPIVTSFARAVDRIAKPRLVTLSFLSVAAAMLVFWRLLNLAQPWVSGAFYVWVNIFSVLVVTLFWLVANDLYRPREAKRLFGFIGSGGILGGIAGSSIAAVGAQVIGTPNLLLLSAVLLIACWALVQRLWRYLPEPALGEGETLAVRRAETFLSNPGGFFRLIFQTRYLFLLVGVVGLSKVVSSLIYYQFNPFIEQHFASVDAKTTFTSLFFGVINLVAFVIQFFWTSWVLRWWGLLAALWILPCGLLLGGSALFVAPLFWIAASTELVDHALNYSMHNTAKEMLYLPIDRSIRYKVKPFIDMVVFRFGKGLAAILGILLLDMMQMTPRGLSLVTIPLIGLWLVVAFHARREYTAAIRTTLQDRTAPAASPPRAEGDLVGSLLTSRPPQEKLSLLAKLVTADSAPERARALLRQLEHHEGAMEPDARLAELTDLNELETIIHDRVTPSAWRHQAIAQLGRLDHQEAFDYLCGMVIVEKDAALRYEALRSLVKMRARSRSLQVPRAQLRRQVEHEVKEYERIVQVAHVYQQQHPGPLAADDPVAALLRVLMEEAVEQIFRLLVLLYRPEDICLIYDQLRAPDTHLRADAVELLDNLVDPQMRAVLLPVFDEDRFLSDGRVESPHTAYTAEVAYRVLQDAIWDHHYWLSVTTLCAVGRLGLKDLRQELEKASRHSVPLVAVAAQLALHLTGLA